MAGGKTAAPFISSAFFKSKWKPLRMATTNLRIIKRESLKTLENVVGHMSLVAETTLEPGLKSHKMYNLY